MPAKSYCKNSNIKLAFSSFKIGNLLTVKDRVHRSVRSCVVYKFSCAGYNSVYSGETIGYLTKRVREHLHTNRNSHIFKDLKNSHSCKFNEVVFKVLDSASNYNK